MVRDRRLGCLLAAAVTACALLAPATASARTSPLSGWWPMNEGKGQTIYDWSGNGNNGTLGSTSGTDDNDPSWIKGVFFGSALRFDGNDFVRIPDSSDLESQNLTVSAWVRADALPRPVQVRDGEGPVGRLHQPAPTAYTPATIAASPFYVYDGSGSPRAGYRGLTKADPTVWDGRWHHVAGTYDGQNVRLLPRWQPDRHRHPVHRAGRLRPAERRQPDRRATWTTRAACTWSATSTASACGTARCRSPTSTRSCAGCSPAARPATRLPASRRGAHPGPRRGAPLRCRPLRRRGGVATQRPAKPFTPVRFRSAPLVRRPQQG